MTLRERCSQSPVGVAAEIGAVMYLVGALLHAFFLWWLGFGAWLIAVATFFWPVQFISSSIYLVFLGVSLLAGLAVAKRRG